jgi:Tfp pilus assembly protein PilF
MSLILDALRKAKSLAGRSAPPKAPAYLKSFGFTEQTSQNKTKKILITYVLPVVVLGAIIASGVVYWISRTAASPMQQQVALLDGEGGLPSELVSDDPIAGDDPLQEQVELPREGDPESPDGADIEASEDPSGVPSIGELLNQTVESEPGNEEMPPALVPGSEPPPFEPLTDPEESATLESETGITPAATPAATEEVSSTTDDDDRPPTLPEGRTTEDPSTDPPAESEPAQISPPAADPFRLAVFYQQQGDYPKALEYYQQILNNNPLNAVVHNNVGLIHNSLSNNEEAIRSFRSAILVNERYDLAHNNLGITLMADGRDAEATGEFRRALELNSQNTAAMTNLAILSKNAGKLEDAKFQYLRALQLDPTLVQAHYNLAFIFEEQGENGSAVRHLQRFLELGSGRYPGLMDEVQRKIQELSRKEP